MLSTQKLFYKEEEELINEFGVETAVVGGLALVIGGLFQAISSHQKANQIESLLLTQYDDDYLKLKLDSDIAVNEIMKNFTVRGKLLKRFTDRQSMTLIVNMEAARLLKQHFSKYPIFKYLFENKELNYKSGEDFFKDHKTLFNIFGDFRSKTAITWDGAIKAFVTLGLSKNINELDDKVIANLYFLALFFRQLALYKDKIDEMTFKFKKVQIRHNY
jgi:hypothetical protein